MNKTDTETKMERLSIEFSTDWIYPENEYKKRCEIRAEKISFYAAAIFELIEMSCEDYVPLGIGELNPEYAHRHLLAIREAAELGKHLASNQI